MKIAIEIDTGAVEEANWPPWPPLGPAFFRELGNRLRAVAQVGYGATMTLYLHDGRVIARVSISEEDPCRNTSSSSP